MLDAILQKAKKVRKLPQNKGKDPALPSAKSITSTLSSRSSQQTTKVYKQPVAKTTKFVRKPGSNSKSCPKVGQRKKSYSSAKMTIRNGRSLPSATPIEGYSGHSDGHSIPPSSVAARETVTEDDTHKRIFTTVNSDSGKCLGANSDHQETFTFNVQQHGCVGNCPANVLLVLVLCSPTVFSYV